MFLSINQNNLVNTLPIETSAIMVDNVVKTDPKDFHGCAGQFKDTDKLHR